MSEFTYTAFISYRHIEPDKAVAKKLHSLIETYGIPAAVKRSSGKNKMGRVFRDEEELPLSSDLGGDITAALKESEWLIVVCSPELLKSKWCMKEIDTFIELGRKDHILTVLVDGEPRDSFPPQLLYDVTDKGAVEKEPLAADVRANSVGGMLKRLQNEKLRLLAPMLGVSYDTLRQRGRERRLRVIAASLAALLICSAAFTAYALRQRQLIAEQRDKAAQSAIELLIEKSALSTVTDGLPQGASYALEAYEMSRGMDGRYDKSIEAALSATLYPGALDRVAWIGGDKRIMRNVLTSPDGGLAAATLGADELAVFDLKTAELLFSMSVKNAIYRRPACAFSDDSQRLFIADGDVVNAYNARTGELIGSESVTLTAPSSAGFVAAADGSFTVTANGFNGFAVYDAVGELLWEYANNSGNTSYSLTLFGNDRYLLASHSLVHIFDMQTGKQIFTTGDALTYGAALTDTLLLIPYRSGGLCAYLLPDAGVGVTQNVYDGELYTPEASYNGAISYESEHFAYSAFYPPFPLVSPDGRYMTLCHADGFVEIFEPAKGTAPTHTVFESSYQMLDVAYHDDFAAMVGYGGSVLIYDIAGGKMFKNIPVGGMMQTSVEFSPDGSMLIVLDLTQNAVYVLSVEGGTVIMRLDGGSHRLYSAAFSADGKQAVGLTTGGPAIVGTLIHGLENLVAAAENAYGGL